MLTVAFAGPSLPAVPQASTDNLWDVREVVDQRDTASTILGAAIARGDTDALRLWGVMGPEVCDSIRGRLASDSAKTKEAALLGLMHCGDTSAFNDVASLVETATDTSVRIAALKALAFVTAEDNRPDLATLVSEQLGDGDTTPDIKAVAVHSLMQSITYAGLKPDQIPTLDLNLVMDAAAQGGALGLEAAYLLTRLNGLSAKIAASDIIEIVESDVPEAQKGLLIRVLGQFGTETLPMLQRIANGENITLATRAISALGQVPGREAKDALWDIAEEQDGARQQAAVAALAGRAVLQDDALTSLLISFTDDENPWVAATALRGLMRLEIEGAAGIAKTWLEGDDYYRAFVAMGLLAGSEEGKTIIVNYAADNEGTIRGREAAIALDPSIEAVEKPRKTPSTRLVQSYQKRKLLLQTTRGPICIAPLADAPYAAANFMLLADSGKMDGMLWHRVISNFVAQAGQSEDFSLASWGTIREERGGARHEPGTVGVATAGPDTGSTQFFINTSHNLHLDNRYTVFGRVTKGMDAAYALEEGDMISSATTVRASAAECQ